MPYYYKINDDGLMANVRVFKKWNEPEGFEPLPKNLLPSKPVFVVDGKLTNDIPDWLKEEKANNKLIAEKMEDLRRQDAISQLKAEGKLPADFKDGSKLGP